LIVEHSPCTIDFAMKASNFKHIRSPPMITRDDH
jgi:hypothetical protein